MAGHSTDRGRGVTLSLNTGTKVNGDHQLRVQGAMSGSTSPTGPQVAIPVHAAVKESDGEFRVHLVLDARAKESLRKALDLVW